MRKLVLLGMLALFAIGVFGQSGYSPVQAVRVTSLNATLGAKFAKGTVFVILATGKEYVAVESFNGTAEGYTFQSAIDQNKVKWVGTMVTGGKGLNIVSTDSTAYNISVKTGLATDSILKVESTVSQGNWLQANTTGVIGKTDAQLKTALGIGAAKSEYFTAENDSCVAGRSYMYTFQLAQTPISGSINVELNGVNLKTTTQWAVILTNKVRVLIPVYQYDNVNISYTY